MPQHPDAEEAWRRHRLELENAVLVAAGELAKIVRANPNASLDEIAAIYHGVANKFRPIAAASAFRALENSRRVYDQWDLPDPVAADALSFQQARATTGWALWNADNQRYDPAAPHLSELVGSLGRAVRGGSRDTIYRSARRAKTLYARVPGVKACWFCLMLASRKAEYTSREAAGVVQNRKSKRFGMAFHDHCSCMVIESYSDADLPNILHDLDQEWQATVGIANHPEVEPGWQRAAWREYIKQTRPMGHSVREILDDGSVAVYPTARQVAVSSKLARHVGERSKKNPRQGGHLEHLVKQLQDDVRSGRVRFDGRKSFLRGGSTAWFADESVVMAVIEHPSKVTREEGLNGQPSFYRYRRTLERPAGHWNEFEVVVQDYNGSRKALSIYPVQGDDVSALTEAGTIEAVPFERQKGSREYLRKG